MRASSELPRTTEIPKVRVLSPPNGTLARASTRKLIIKKAPTEKVAEKVPLQLPKSILKVTRPKKIVITNKPTEKRPTTPTQTMTQCLDCDNVKDFIAALQGEIKRLQVSPH